jgi:soluble cytochrome b562
MQGISQSKHQHLVDALLQMEQVLKQNRECVEQAVEYRVELESMHKNYERLLDKLANQISEYEALYAHVKIQYVGKKLKELKKEIPVEKPAFALLTENIRLAYGT